MKHRTRIEELQGRLFWTPKEAARILGRGASFWRVRYDNGEVDGYQEPDGTRYICAVSAREFLMRRRNPRYGWRTESVEAGSGMEIPTQFWNDLGVSCT